MSDPKARQRAAIARFRALHLSGCFVLPNPWDAGSAVFLARLGFEALAAASAGFAFTQALPDDVTAVPRDVMLAHVRDIVGATPLPVNADFLAGYADDPEGVAGNVALCVATGAAGLRSRTRPETLPRRSTSAASRSSGSGRRAGRSTTAACRWSSPLAAKRGSSATRTRSASPSDRLAAFAEAGADCLFAPGVRAPEQIATIVKEVAPRPVNVLVSAPSPVLSMSQLADLGVRRVSVGSALGACGVGGVPPGGHQPEGDRDVRRPRRDRVVRGAECRLPGVRQALTSRLFEMTTLEGIPGFGGRSYV